MHLFKKWVFLLSRFMLFLACIIFASSGYAQNTFPGSGNVGIGTISPRSVLNVIGGGVIVGTNAVTNNSDGALSIGSISASYTPTTANWNGIGSTLILSALPYSTIAFHHSGARVDFIRAGNGTIQLGYDGGWGPANIGLPNGVWSSTGNLGIGTITPASKLTVSQTADPVLGTDGNGGARVYNAAGTSFGQLQVNISGIELSSSGTTTLPLFLNVSRAAVPPLTIGMNGFVGLGTTTPKEQLSVNGNIRAKQVKVELANWPDYVFSQNYKSYNLNELDQYIKTNHHLPEIPSAKEVEKEGINLGEINAKLLKKIEELTLIIIEQNRLMQKKDMELQQRIQVLEKRNTK